MSNERNGYRIVVVDDEPLARHALGSVLHADGFEVREAADGSEGLDMVRSWTPHMVIADIQMPVMDGFTLLEQVRSGYPSIRRVLITAGGIDERISLMREHDVGNVIPKGGSMKAGEFCEYIHALLSGRIFGLERFFPGRAVRSMEIRTPEDARAACAAVAEGLNARDPLVLEMAVDELVSNAVFHGVLQGPPRNRWHEGFCLPESQRVVVAWVRDSEKVGVSVTDPAGKLRKADVLRWLDKPLQERHGDEEHGRGLLLVRRIIDRFIINISPDVRTECIVIQYDKQQDQGKQKPLLVHEI